MHRSGAVMAWNVFKFCTALRGLGSIMILLVLGVVGVTYYAVVLTSYGPALYDGGLTSVIAVAVLILFHGLLVMLLWSYFSVVLTDPGGVPPNWRPIMDEERGEGDPLTGSDFGVSPADASKQRVRWEMYTEDGPSLCLGCELCWGFELQIFPSFLGLSQVAEGLHNSRISLGSSLPVVPPGHKSEFYTFLETSLVTLSLLPHFIAFFTEGEIPGSPGTLATTFLAFVLNLAFALSVMGFLIMHISMVAANTTTIEAYEKKTTLKWRYDLGRKKNFEQASIFCNILPLQFVSFLGSSARV
ncbi:putative protein S-acyltransferase 14 [Vitis vinifera]|uniref:Uncharacterized protein n=1 Tax=Vitis vinifera TaxID=29760 RepID=A0A438IWC1_VITVI|nr:putative protein S-acyltransferase 14 [Vitis vinifera]